MRADLAPVLLHALLALSGLAILDVLGLLRRSVRGVIAALGLAYMAGLALIALCLVFVLIAGVPFGLPTVFAILVVELLAWAVVAVRIRPRRWWEGDSRIRVVIDRERLREWLRRLRPDTAATAAFGLLLAPLALVGALRAGVKPLEDWDSWSIWAAKAIVLTDYNHLPAAYFTTYTATVHPDYPLVVPIFEALQFRFMGTVDVQAVHVGFWVLYVAFFWGAAYLANRLTRPVVWAPLLLAAMVAPGFMSQIFSGYADVPMALFLFLGVLSVGWWTAERRPAALALGALMLGAAANSKNEGMMAAVATLLAAAAVVCVRPAHRSYRALAALAISTIVLILPWRLWLAAHHLKGDLPVGKGLSPSFLSAHASRVDPAARAVYGELVNQGRWLYLLPMGLAVAVACLLTRRATRVALFYVVLGAIATFGLVWSYWISPYDLNWHLRTSVARVVTIVVAISAAGVLQLSGLLLQRGPVRMATAPGELETAESPPEMAGASAS